MMVIGLNNVKYAMLYCPRSSSLLRDVVGIYSLYLVIVIVIISVNLCFGVS